MKTPSDDFPRDLIAPLQTPPVSGAERDRALSLALAALGQPEPADSSEAGLGRWIILAGSLGAVVVLAAWWLTPGVTPAEPNPGLILAEMEKLFPQQLDSVIVDGTDVRVNVAGTPTATPADQRIRLVLQRGAHSLGVLTYSGRKVCIPLEGGDVCLTPLMRGDGTVFVLTETQVLSDEAAVLPSGHHVHMERLQEGSS